ncbi:hypothetical protein [Paraburkholderia hospita]|uniref:hypothetical protein n=1 Tax=Paraburkholderia hospita TaxID=169430 RepID=UPI000B34A17A|nr:hypothetical protein [Paraburkholderia hospita]OUL82243.1 hypothetical protein CA601_29475 [Paraburkholderia hospita]
MRELQRLREEGATLGFLHAPAALDTALADHATPIGAIGGQPQLASPPVCNERVDNRGQFGE